MKTSTTKKAGVRKTHIYINIDGVTDPEEILYRLAIAKHNAKILLTDDELDTIIKFQVKHAIRNTIFSVVEEMNNMLTEAVVAEQCATKNEDKTVKTKKPGILRRFWNWLTRK